MSEEKTHTKMSPLSVVLKTGKTVKLPKMANFFRVQGFNCEYELHWFDFTEEERKELAEAIGKVFRERKQITS